MFEDLRRKKRRMICPFVNRECTPDCLAYTEEYNTQCLVLYKIDRTNKLLNFIDKKVSDILNRA